MSYLGKISAVLVADAKGWAPNLNMAASELTKFDRKVRSTLNSSATASARAMEGIYTPIQKMERAIQAMFTRKLSFNLGGAIKSVDELKTRIADLSRRQINVSVAGTAFSSLKQLRDAIRDVKQEDIEWVKSLGGLDAARGLSGAMSASELKRLNRFSGVGSLDQITGAVDVMGGRMATDAANQLRAMHDAAEQLGKPLGESVAKFMQLGDAAKVGLVPTMHALQADVEAFYETIKTDTPQSQQQFDQLRDRVAAFAQQVKAAGIEVKNLGLFGFGGEDPLARARRLSAQFDKLPAADQASLHGRASFAANLANSVAAGGGNPAHLTSALNDLEQAMDAVSASRQRAIAVGQMHLNVLQRESQAISVSGAGSLEQYERDIDASTAARNRAVAAGQMYLRILSDEEVQAAATAERVRQIGLANARLSQIQVLSNQPKFSAQFGPTAELGIQRVSLAGYAAQMQILQQALAGVNTEARRGANEVFARLARAIDEAAEAGTVDVASVRVQLRGLMDDAARATAAVTGGDLAGLQGRLARGGDIGRAGAQKFSLALNQAAYVIDDFFSVTGGWDQRVRAIGNNLTQIGFILGETRGLWIALTAVVAAQAAIFAGKYIFAMETAEEKQRRLQLASKSLNDTLASQKSAVETLAEAYKSLGTEIRQALSEEGRRVAERGETVEELQEKQVANRRELVAGMHPEVMAIRAERALLEDQLSKATTAGERVSIQDKIRGNQFRERDLFNKLDARAEFQRGVADPAEVAKNRRQIELELAAGLTPRKDLVTDTAIEALAVQKNVDDAMLAVAEQLSPLADELGKLNERAKDLGGWMGKGADALDADVKALDEARRQASEGALDAAGVAGVAAGIGGRLSGYRADLERANTRRESYAAGQEAARRAGEEADASGQRGLGYLRTPAQDLADQMVDIRRAFGLQAEEGNGLVDFAGMAAAQAKAAGEVVRNGAGAIFGLEESVMNAVLQGPSRAALQASDTRTSEGAAELNRLLRGDDPSKNQNLVELRKQGQFLKDILDELKKQGIAPVLDL
jgi:hypothetical protein